MAKKLTGVWGIEIGQSALKALRLVRTAEGSLQAEAFDFIEYPQLLSEPDADAAELIREALNQLISRNEEIRSDKVAISVPGQSGLARFIKLPPVESKKIPDIVRYEARQQIPFPLDEVIWDYQQIGGGGEEDGFALETEVGLFAMKREQVFEALEPLTAAGIEVDVIQLTPLSLYNFIVHDQFADLPPADEYDPDDPPESVVLLSLGCETTDLVVTNGYKVWQRSIPIGGNHFTKALTKELDLTFAKAEHLKRNATQSNDPKAVFQAMRPVFNDLVTECQRSIGYFTNVDRNAKIKHVLGLGNMMKLPGIRTYLAQNLGYDVNRLDKFASLEGPAVVDAPAFKENLLTFGPCYGLALQGMGEAKLKTNLLPPEMVQERMIRAKKPWAVAAAALLMLGLTINTVGYWRAWNTVHEKHFGTAESTATSATNQARKYSNDFQTRENDYKDKIAMGEQVVENVEGRYYWLELLKAVNLCLPSETMQGAFDGAEPGAEDWWNKVSEQERIHITRFEAEKVDNLEGWWAMAQKAAVKGAAGGGGDDGGGDLGQGQFGNDPGMNNQGGGDAFGGNEESSGQQGPSGSGWVIRLTGHHYHNPDRDPQNQGRAYVRKTFVANLQKPEIEIKVGDQVRQFPVRLLGIQNPIITADTGINWDFNPKNAAASPFGGQDRDGGMGPIGQPMGMGEFGPGGGGFGPGPVAPAPADPAGGPKVHVEEIVKLPRMDFQIQFAWTITSVAERRALKEEMRRRELEEAQRKAQEAEEAARQAAGGVAQNF